MQGCIWPDKIVRLPAHSFSKSAPEIFSVRPLIYIQKQDPYIKAKSDFNYHSKGDQSPIGFYSLFCPLFFSMNKDWWWHRKIWNWYKTITITIVTQYSSAEGARIYYAFFFKYASSEGANEHFQGNHKNLTYDSNAFSGKSNKKIIYLVFFPLSIMKSPDVSLIFSKRARYSDFPRF